MIPLIILCFSFSSCMFFLQNTFSTCFFLFSCSLGIKCTPLTIEVYERKDTEAEVRDTAFNPEILRIDEGNSIEWGWHNCIIPHSITEVNFFYITTNL